MIFAGWMVETARRSKSTVDHKTQLDLIEVFTNSQSQTDSGAY